MRNRRGFARNLENTLCVILLIRSSNVNCETFDTSRYCMYYRWTINKSDILELPVSFRHFGQVREHKPKKWTSSDYLTQPYFIDIDSTYHLGSRNHYDLEATLVPF